MLRPFPPVAGDPAWQITPDGLSRVNELRLPREYQVTRTGAQGVLNVELLQFLSLWASETPPLAACRKKAQTIEETPRRRALSRPRAKAMRREQGTIGGVDQS